MEFKNEQEQQRCGLHLFTLHTRRILQLIPLINATPFAVTSSENAVIMQGWRW